MTGSRMTRKPIVTPLSGMALSVYLLLVMALPFIASAQNADIAPSVQPAPRVRLIGVLRPLGGADTPAFPQVKMWIGGTPWLFHVCQVEPLIPAYPAEEELRKVSGLGLRLVTDSDELATLHTAERHKLPIVIDGQLRVRAGLFWVDTTYTTESAAAQCGPPIAG